MKNKLLNFIDLLIFFFNQGYSLQETLDFCSLLNYEKEVKENNKKNKKNTEIDIKIEVWYNYIKCRNAFIKLDWTWLYRR